MSRRVARSQAMRYVTSPSARSTSLTVPAQPPSGMSGKSGSRTQDLTRTLAPIWSRAESDGFLGRDMTKNPVAITSRMGERGLEVGDAGQEDGVRLMVMVGEEDELVPVVRAGPELEKP